MAADHRTPATLNFNDFCLDLRSLELRKGGLRVRLRHQPAQLLATLAKRAGELVTREELQQELWGADTFVDFERGLNNCIKQIRQALNDDLESPRFIETIPRQGYRFIASVEPRGSSKAPATALQSNRRARTLILAGVLVIAAVSTVAILRLRKSSTAHTASHPISSLAVLPLENLSSDKESDFYAEGMTDELITELAKLGALRVISRASIIPYEGKRKPLQEITHALKVDAVVEGTVLRLGKRVRVTVQLIQVDPERHLWAESYERDETDVLALQSELAHDIANHIRIRLTPAEQARLSRSAPVDPQVYQAYLEGRYYWNTRTEEGINKGMEYFREAIAKDPGYAPAYAGLARSYITLEGYRILPAKAAFPFAKAAALKAVQLDEGLAEAHTVLAVLLVDYDLDPVAAEKEFKRTMELSPSDATAYQWYAEEILSAPGRHQEAIAAMKRALELDPLSMAVNTYFGTVLYWAGENEEAIAQLKKTIEINRNLPIAHRWLGLAYSKKGMFKEAVDEFQTAVTLSGAQPFYLASLGYAYAAAA